MDILLLLFCGCFSVCDVATISRRHCDMGELVHWRLHPVVLALPRSWLAYRTNIDIKIPCISGVSAESSTIYAKDNNIMVFSV